MTDAIGYEYSAKAVRDKFKAQGVFYTDLKLARVLKDYMPPDVLEVYDPTCGNGNLLSVFDDHVQKYGQELDEAQANVASERLTNAHIVAGDTLEAPAFVGKKFRAIVANPPFSVKWLPPMLPDERFSIAPTVPTASRADYAFLLHILHYLAEDGVAVVLSFPGVLYRGNREGTLRRWMVETLNVIDAVINVQGDYFTDTKIQTAIIILRKNRPHDAPITFSELHTGESIAVSREQVKANDYVLSTHPYLKKEEVKEEVDIEALNDAVALAVGKKLRNDLEWQCALIEAGIEESTRLAQILDDLEHVITDYRQRLATITPYQIAG